MYSCALSRPVLRRQRPGFLSTVTLGVGLAASAAAQALPISLPEELIPPLREILIRAAQQSPAVQSSNIELARSEANYIGARAALLPNIYTNASYNWSETQVRDQPESASKNDGLYYSVGVSQPVFHWGAIKAQADIARLESLIAEKNLAEIYRGVTTTLRGQYLGLVLKKMALRHQQFAQKMAEDQLAVQEERLRNGIISEGDILEPRLNAEEARYATLTFEHDLDASVRVFGQLAGQKDLTRDAVPDLVPRPEYSGDLLASYFRQLSSESIRDLPQAMAYELRKQQDDKRYHIERTRLLPKVGSYASWGVSNFTTVTPTAVTQTPTEVTSAGISANWTLFDGFSSRGGKMAALASKRLNERMLDTYMETTMNQLRTLQANIEASARLLDMSERREVLAREQVRLTRQNLELGNASQSEVEGVINNQNKSEGRTANARANFLLAWASYVSLVGLDPIMQEAQPLLTRDSPRRR